MNKSAIIHLAEQFAKAGIRLQVVKKSVKNINFRIKSGVLWVSAPLRISDNQLLMAIQSRMEWAISAHQRQQLVMSNAQDKLWGEALDVQDWLIQHREHIHGRTYQRLQSLSHDEQKHWIYHSELTKYIAQIQQHWQQVVGKSASAISIKNMSSRWGSCNVRTAKVALSLHLASYPPDCTDYVFVHELCHLHHANHSAEFWASVKKAMPDYQTWHMMLKGRC